MQLEQAIALAALLAPIAGRSRAATQVARQFGAESLVLLSRNEESGLLLPAGGLGKTLPGGAQWREFLEQCRTAGLRRGHLTGLDGSTLVPAAACSDGKTAVIFLGGAVEDAALAALAPTLALLGGVLHEQQRVDICGGELAAARFEMRQYATQARALDEARAQVDRTVREMALQARRLDEARALAEAATRAKDHFLAMLGHELRNPLAPIVTVLQLLQRRGQWSPEHAIMQRQVEHLQRLVNDLLDVSRIAGGKLTLDRRVVEMADVVRLAYESTHPLVAHKRQKVTLDLPSSGLPVDADPERMVQVFANLITNASKYSDVGHHITVRASSSEDSVIVEVCDEGAGIDPSMLDRVFNLFEQETSSLDRADGGLGLGLAIVRNLVDQHGGRVHAESEGCGRGSRFVVQVPLAQQSPVLAAPATVASPEVAQPGPVARVLLVDDNADALTTMSTALQIMGFTVEIAVDGISALEVARTFRPHLAMLDIGLPGMDGYELARQLRSVLAIEPPKLLALTGYGQPSEKQLAREAGFDAHLVKPVDLFHLRDVIDGLLATVE